jgi:hypothetical protein
MKSYTLYIITFVIINILISNTSISQDANYQKHKVGVIPNFILARMDSFIIAKTGKIIFEKYFVFDTIQSGCYSGDTSVVIQYGDSVYSYRRFPYYYFAYKFRDPQKPWLQMPLHWPTDINGNFNKYYLPYGIPNCKSDSSSFFLIDSSKAISIAQSHGLKGCLDQPTATFKLGIDTKHANKEDYIWVVYCDSVRGTGRDIYLEYCIDINTGAIVHKDTTRLNSFTL